MDHNDTTVSTPKGDEAETTKLYLIPVTFLSSFLISSGNILTIAAIVTNPSLQTRSNAFVASLATADIVVGIAVFSFGLWLVPSVRDLFESAIFICVSQLANAFMSIFVSINSMLLVAIDRWFIISNPFLYQRLISKKVIVGAILLPWIFGFIFGFSQFFILNPDRDPPVCQITSLYPKVYYNIITPLCYYLAVAGIFIFYFKIILIARHHGKVIRRQNQVQAQNFNATDEAVQQTTNTRSGFPKFDEQHWKAAKMMMTIFGVFFVCWTPRIVMYSVDAEYSVLLSDATINIGLLNSGVNFLVYPLHSREFRTAFKKMLCRFRR